MIVYTASQVPSRVAESAASNVPRTFFWFILPFSEILEPTISDVNTRLEGWDSVLNGSPVLVWQQRSVVTVSVLAK